MSENKRILILANSVRAGKHCVAGKIAMPTGDGNHDVGEKWIRLNDPRDPEGAVPYISTLCPGHGPVRPLDIVTVDFQSACGDPDHPEDWLFEPTRPWQYVGKADAAVLPTIVDTPTSIWHDGTASNSVSAGYVQKMEKPATLYLVKAPSNWRFTFWNEWNSWESRNDTKRKLNFTYNRLAHEFSVTDAQFTARHDIYNRATEGTQTLQVASPTEVFFCLSLTKLTPKFPKHYKICATVFELPA